MRDLLTGVAILLLLALTAALIGPHIVDWNSRRDLIAQQVSQALGGPVSIEGPISLELLPTPTLKLGHVRVAGDGVVTGTVGRFRAKLSVPPLMRGNIRMTEVILHGADLTFSPKARPGSPTEDPGLLSSSAIDQLVIRNSRLRLISANGSSHVDLTGVEGQFEAQSLEGPFRGVAAFDSDGKRLALRLSTGKIADGAIRLKAQIENDAAATRIDYDGSLQLAANSIMADGVLAASGNASLTLGERVEHMIWRWSSHVASGNGLVALDKIEIALGNADRQAVLTGIGDIDWKRERAANIILSGRQIDLDRLLAGEDRKTLVTPESLLRAALGSMAGKAALPLAGTLDVSLGSLMLGGEAILGPRLLIDASASGAMLRQASGEMPGRTVLNLDASAASQTGRLVGQLSFESRDLARLSGWFHGVPPRPLGLKALKLEGELRQEATGFGISGARLVADEMRLTGDVFYRQDGVRPGLRLALKADQLDVARLPDWQWADATGDRAGLWDLDLDVQATRVRYRGAGAGDIALRLRRNDGPIHLETLRVSDLGGASLVASGVLSGERPALTGKLTASRLEALLELAERVVPNAALPFIAARAASLAPADLAVDWSSNPAQAGKSSLRINGRLGVTVLDGTFRLDGDGGLDGANALALSLKAPEPSNLLRQIGIDAIPIGGAGAVDLALAGSGPPANGAETPWSLRGSFGGMNIVATAAWTSRAEEPLRGTLALATPDFFPLAQTMLLAVPAIAPGQGLSLKAGFDLRGYRITFRELEMQSDSTPIRGEIAFNLAEFGRVSGQLRTGALDAGAFAPLIFGEGGQLSTHPAMWGRAPFGPAAAVTLPGDLWIEADALNLSDGIRLRQPKFVLRFDQGLIFLEHVVGQWMDGALTGQATLRRSAQGVSLTARVSVDGMNVDGPGLATASGRLRGRATASLDVSATGESPLALVSALSGTGRIALERAEVEGLALGALDEVMAQNLDLSTLTREGLTASLRQKLSGTIALPATEFPMSVAAGVWRAGPIRIATPREEITGALAVDLRDMTMQGRTSVVARMQPPGWSGPPAMAEITLRGPVAAPVRAIDISSLANGLTAIAIQRETERIEALEQDQRERSFHNRRLRAAEEQRKAEEEERRRQEAAARAADEQTQRLDLQQRIEEIIRTAPNPASTGGAPPPVRAPLPITPPLIR